MIKTPDYRTHRGGSVEYGERDATARTRQCEDAYLGLTDMGFRLVCVDLPRGLGRLGADLAVHAKHEIL